MGRFMDKQQAEGHEGPQLEGAHSHGPQAGETQEPGPGQRPDARPQRVASRNVDDFAVPGGREEAWRFSPVKRLRPLLVGEPAVGDGVTVKAQAAPEVRVEPLTSEDERVGSVLTPGDRLSAVAMACFGEEGTVVTVPRNAVAAQPTVLTFDGRGGRAYGHVFIDVEPAAEATVVLDHVGSADYAANVEVRVGDGASLTLVSLQDWDDTAVHAGTHAVALGRDASLHSVVVTLGGEVVRLVPTVEYTGRGGDAELLGLYFADAGQHLEHRSFVDHAVPDCRSRVTYKGALQGRPDRPELPEARTVWVGDVLIQHPATGTDTYETNRNLLLTDGARADSVPNLEIETGEVAGAGHASATGRFDDEQLFYLMARGIPADQARRLVVRGFFAEIIAKIHLPEIEKRLSQAIEDELAEVGT